MEQTDGLPNGERGARVIIRNFFNDKLAQASYLVGCAATGEAIVIDPLRDISPYLASAEAEGLHIVAVTETHIHADYLSGSRELSAATGARMYLSDEGDADWKYAFADEELVTLVRHGDKIKIGNLSLEVLHTPGHTPEHISFLLTDHPATDAPHSIFTGDFVFVGDVGRPDLLERAAHFAGTMEKGARVLFNSLQNFKRLGETILVWPAHGAGSACGKALGGVPVSSLGYEKHTNWGLRAANEDLFVEEVLSGQPEPPYYFKEMKMRNKQGPVVLGRAPSPVLLDSGLLPSLLAAKAQVVDTRLHDEIRAGMVPNSIAIPGTKSFITWAGWLLDYENPIYLIADSQESANQRALELGLIGLDRVEGWFASSRLAVEVDLVPVMAFEVDSVPDQYKVLDVRGSSERERGSVADSAHIPLGYLVDRVHELDHRTPVAVHCQSGGRSLIGVSLLVREGFGSVAEIPAGFAGFEACRPAVLA